MTDEPGKIERLPQTPIVVTPPNPMFIVEKAITSGASVETLEKLLAMQESWERRQNQKAFDEALAAARREITPIAKTRTADRGNRGGTYQYEDLSLIAEVIDPIFGKHGLNYRWVSPKPENGILTVTCVISGHGHREECATLSAGLDASGGKNDVQALGSTASYLQRYTLRMSAGLSAGKDNDANVDKPAPQTISQEQYEELVGLLIKTNRDEDTLLRYLNLPPTADLHVLTIPQYEKAKFGMLKFLKDTQAQEKADDISGQS